MLQEPSYGREIQCPQQSTLCQLATAVHKRILTAPARIQRTLYLSASRPG